MKRREFGEVAFAGLLGGTLKVKDTQAQVHAYKKTDWLSDIAIKPAEILQSMPTAEQLVFAKQAGAEYIEAWMPGDPAYQDIENLKNTVENAGLHLWSTDILQAYNAEQCIMGLPGRDDKINQLQNFIRNLGKAGLHTTTLAWTPPVAYSTGSTTVRGGCTARDFNARMVSGSSYYTRDYSDEEIWDNLAYFLDRVLPVAEDSGVRLAFHPGDPPMTLRGCPSILSSNIAYTRLLEMGNNSTYLGAAFCVGTWSEMAGPSGDGEDVIGAIYQLGSDHIYTVHFRNVSSPVPDFHETFVDEGYVNMYLVMKAFMDIGFGGTVVPDHVPGFTNEKRLGHMAVSGSAYTLGAIRMAMLAAKTEIAHEPAIISESFSPAKNLPLMSNHPNPFNLDTTIQFELPEAGYIKLVIYSITGQTIRELAADYVPAGAHSFMWDGKDNDGASVSSGLYIAQLRMGQKVASMKMTLMK